MLRFLKSGFCLNLMFLFLFSQLRANNGTARVYSFLGLILAMLFSTSIGNTNARVQISTYTLILLYCSYYISSCVCFQ
jgi:hypothetical protein